MTAESVGFWVIVVALVLTGVVLWTARSAPHHSGWRRVFLIARIALFVELILVVAAVLFYLSFDDRMRF